MENYPILIKSNHIKALVVGAGNVGLRKIETLLNCGVESITVIDKKKFSLKHTKASLLKIYEREFNFTDLEQHNLVFAATDNKELNAEIALECHKKNIFVNLITTPHEGSFTLPALIQKGEILLTLSTHGNSPALSKVIKEDLSCFLDEGYVQMCDFLGKLRPKLLALNLKSSENTAIFHIILTSPLKENLLPLFATNTKESKKKIFALCSPLLPFIVLPLFEELLC